MSWTIPPDVWWSRDASLLLDLLGSRRPGLPETEAVRRRAVQGRNTMESESRLTGVRLLFKQFSSPLVLILTVAAVILLLTRDWVEAGIVLFIILGSGLLSFFQEHRASTAVQALKLFRFGLLSTAFDLLSFVVLLELFRASQPLFQTAWFVISLLSELAVVFVLGTSGPVWRGRPGRLLGWTSLAVGLGAMVIPHLGPVARLFDFVPLPPSLLGASLLIVTLYIAATEYKKRIHFRASSHQP